jgi:heme-degrading monooxygenase HmoA
MENKFVVGTVFVPKDSVDEFRSQNTTSQFLKKLPGFIKGEAYERIDDSGNLNLVSVTVWSNSESYNNAQRSLKEHYESIKFNPIAYRERLKIVFDNGLYLMHDY